LCNKYKFTNTQIEFGSFCNVYLCIHQQNHFLNKTNTHKTVCEGKNIRRDGTRRFVYLCICVFTNKITALKKREREIERERQRIPQPQHRNRNRTFLTALNLGGSGAGLLETPTDLMNADMSVTTRQQISAQQRMRRLKIRYF
jgi:hypothetical protein